MDYFKEKITAGNTIFATRSGVLPPPLNTNYPEFNQISLTLLEKIF